MPGPMTPEGPWGVPAADSAANNTIRDVLGNKTDTHSGDSLYGRAKLNDEHNHSVGCVYPELADPVTLTASANDWTDYGAWVEIVPVDTITSDFDIHFLDIAAASAAGDYEVQLASGLAASEVLISCSSFSVPAGAVKQAQIVIITPMIPANTRVSARISSGNAAANTTGVKVHYHTY